MKTIVMACCGVAAVCVGARGEVLLSARPLNFGTFVNFMTPPSTAPTVFSAAIKPETPSGFVLATPTLKWDIPVTTVGAWSGDITSSDPSFATCVSLMSDGVPTASGTGCWFVWGIVGVNYPGGFGGSQVVPAWPGPVGSTVDFFPYTITRFRLVVSGFSYTTVTNSSGKVSYQTTGTASVEVWGVPTPGTGGVFAAALVCAARRRRR